MWRAILIGFGVFVVVATAVFLAVYFTRKPTAARLRPIESARLVDEPPAIPPAAKIPLPLPEKFAAEYFLSTLTIMKNESMVIEEFIQHYKEQGVDHMHIINNGSSDNAAELVLSFGDFVTLYDLPEKHKQVEHYNSVYSKIRHTTKWLAVVDADEFMFATGDGQTLRDVMADKPTSTNYVLNWNLFGGSGHVKQPQSIRRSFVYRFRGMHENVKSIVSTEITSELTIHDNKPSVLLEGCQLNHYAIMSREYFEKVKMARGDAHTTISDNVRTWAYYKWYDGKDLVEYDLAKKAQAMTKIYKTSFVVEELTEDLLAAYVAEGADHIFVFSNLEDDSVRVNDERVTYCMNVDIQAMIPYYLQDLSETIVIKNKVKINCD